MVVENAKPQESCRSVAPVYLADMTPEEEIGALLKQVRESSMAAIKRWRQQGGAPPLPELQAALILCQEKQRQHPLLALESARLQVNLGAMLSQMDQHQEAVAKVQEAQRTLSTIQAWAHKCLGADPSVGVIASEASKLQSAAQVAESIATEPLVVRGEGGQGRDEKSQVAPLPQLSSIGKAGSHGLESSRSAPTLETPSRTKVSLPPISPNMSSVSTTALLTGDSTSTRGARKHYEAGKRNKGPKSRDKDGQSQKQRKKKIDYSAVHVEHNHKVNNIFKDFLHDVQIEKDLRIRDEHSWEEDRKKQLCALHRLTRLYYMLDIDEELKSKKYTTSGHNILMKNMVADNKSRQDVPLVGEARKLRKSPEVQSLRRLNKLLFVKPPTPEPQTKPNTAKELMKGFNIRSNVSSAA
mmetsp:Transcript_53867/g.125895  ORF Transcript_53867/g.125895 Transcript_53867/m.125895 type:complete len:412 (-) Transcript_53867:84-1319(-)